MKGRDVPCRECALPFSMVFSNKMGVFQITASYNSEGDMSYLRRSASVALSIVLAGSLVPASPLLAAAEEPEPLSTEVVAGAEDVAPVEGAADATEATIQNESSDQEEAQDVTAAASEDEPASSDIAGAPLGVAGGSLSLLSSLGDISILADVPPAGTYTFTDFQGVWTYKANSAGVVALTAFAASSSERMEKLVIPSQGPDGVPFAQINALTNVNAKEVVFPAGPGKCLGLNSPQGLEIVTVEAGANVTGSLGGANLTTVNIGDGATVGNFQNSPKLVTVNVEVGVTFGASAFKNCTALQEVSVPSMSESMFSGCTLLNSVTLMGDSISRYAFTGCTSLKSIDLSNIKSIGDYSFEESGLEGDLVIPEGVETIGNGAFMRCQSLTSVVVPASLTSVLGQFAFSNCGALESVTVNCSEVGSSAFSVSRTASSLKKITIGSGVTSIHYTAFLGVPDSVAVTVDPGNTYLYTTDRTDLVDRASGDQIYPYVEKPAPDPTIISDSPTADATVFTVGATITTIGTGIFKSHHPSIQEIVVEDGNTSFVLDEQGILYTADMKTLIKAPVTLTEAVVPEGVTRIENDAFDNCTKLAKITLPSTLTTLADEVFRNCTSLTSITLPKGLLDMGNGVFEGTSLASLKVTESVWGKDSQKNEANDFVADGGVTSIHSLFYGWNWSAADWGTKTLNTSLTTLDLSSYSGTFVPSYAFAGLLGLQEIVLPASISSVGHGSFYYCLNVKNVYAYNPTSLQIAVGMSGQGNSGSGNAGESYQVTNPGSFSWWDPEAEEYPGIGSRYRDLTGINFYGVAYADNGLITYCAENSQNFIPIVVLQNATGLFGDYEVTYGTGQFDYNHIEIANIPVGGTPQVNAVFGDYATPRTLQDGSGCSIYYTDADGNVVTSFDKAGTYTALIKGDDKGVVGFRSVSFQVGDVPNDPGQTGTTQTGGTVQQTAAAVQQGNSAAQTGALAQTGDHVASVAPLVVTVVAGALTAVGAWFASRRKKIGRH